MRRIEGQLADQEKLAEQVLSWILCARRPLSTLELQHSLAAEPNDTELHGDSLPQIEDMVSVCAGLVTIDEESSIIRLVHYTAQEYFLRTQDYWFPTAEVDIYTTCVTYLSFRRFEVGPCATDKRFEQRLQDNPLYEYSARNWGHHAREASILLKKVPGFLNGKNLVEAANQALLATKLWTNHLNYSQEYPMKTTGTHIAAYFGLLPVVRELIRTELRSDAKDTFGRTPLSWAAENGYEAVVELLLKNGAEIETADIEYGQTPLSLAAENAVKQS